ncbi:DNA/RNA polymerases superfamily protein [Gossypium australe]|uniref:DNA/RNA polymerases superfamily protein n=1 Tax=Gossypium australe TaxID=47621 RepID=A0A5B6VMD7_9ROSI|nr:DNA/RNA polymerases superfamily protein [Gossypium australe]
MSSNQARAGSEEAESASQASVQRPTNNSSRRPKSEGQEFRATIEDDPERAEFWLENTIRVLDELPCTPVECLKCDVSLLKDTSYLWWKIVTSVVPRESITWEFFQTEFRKKYINQSFLDQKRKELLELK